MNKLIKTASPEEEELRHKREELAALEDQLADLELEVGTLHVDTQAFLDTVAYAVAARLLERDLLRARLAEARLAQDPDNEKFINQADTAREEAEHAQQEYDAFSGGPGASQSWDEFESGKRNRSSDEVRTLYRNLVKRVHPDLTTNPEEKEQRTAFMKKVNAAYEAGDQERLEELTKQWDASPESVEGEGVAVDLVRVIRQINLVKDRIEAVNAEIVEIRGSEDYGIFSEASTKGFETYIAELEATLDTEIARLKRELTAVSTEA